MTPRPTAPELDPPLTVPGPVDPVVGVCGCGDVVTKSRLGFVDEAGRVTCWVCVPDVTGEAGA